MKKGIIVNLKRFGLLDYVTRNKFFIILCVLFITGITLGVTVLSENNWLSQNTKFYFTEFINVHTQKSFIQKLTYCFLHYIVVLILYFLSGASMLGVAITPFITVWQGIFIGNAISHIYATYGLNGIAFNAIVFIPPISIFAVCCFFAAKYAINFSLSISKLILPKSRPLNLYNGFKDYCSKYIIFVGITLICSIIEIILNLLFLKFFNF